MAWTSPITFVTGAALTASQLNINVRDNLNETAVAKTTLFGSHYAGNGTTSLAERITTVSYVATQESIATTTPDDLATLGPTVTTTAAGRAILLLSAYASNNIAGNSSVMYTDITGAHSQGVTAQAALRITSAAAGAAASGSYCYGLGVTAGSSTYTSKYAAGAGATTATFQYRRLTVIPF